MKRIISLLLALVIAISAAVPAYATGDGNFDGGGGSMGDGTKTNYWNPGMDGVRVSIVDVGSHSVVRTPIDLTNKVPIANVAHFGKVSKLSYNAGRGLSVSVSGYSYRNPSQSLPKIISTSSSKASIAAIRSYFTDEQVIRAIAGYVGIDFDLLISGDYRIVVEPLAYLCYNGQQFAMTATEAALYDQVVNGDLRKKLGTLTHKNLPLAIFLEEADLGYTAWSGSRTDKASNGDIISSLGIGIVRFNEVTTPPEPGEYDYEYRVNTEVITSVEVRGGQSDPDNPVSVRFNIQGRTYTVSNVYFPQLVQGQVLLQLLVGGQVHQQALAQGGAEGVDDPDAALGVLGQNGLRRDAGGLVGGGQGRGEADAQDILPLLQNGGHGVLKLAHVDVNQGSYGQTGNIAEVYA